MKGHATRYVIKIATGHYDRIDDFTKHVHQIISTDSNRVVAEMPFFGNVYTWKVVYMADGKPIDSSRLCHFKTASFPVEYNKRLRVTNNKQIYHNAYFLVDGINAIFDADGNPVWFLPGNDLLNASTDLKASGNGTITFLSGSSAYEISYSGRIILKTMDSTIMPNGAKTGIVHHHEFTKLKNGQYIALVAIVSEKIADTGRKKFFPNLATGVIKEFDEDGLEVWSWNPLAYVEQSDLLASMKQNSHEVSDFHENAFYFDEHNQIIYLSMAGIDRILKIQYPSGKVLAEYGNKIYQHKQNDITSTPIDLRSMYANEYFHNPHGLKFSGDGYFYLCSGSGMNTGNGGNGYPQILKLKESGGRIKKVWEFDCRDYVAQQKQNAGGGGNVVAITDSTLFVSMCLPHNELFIVNERKELLWSAVSEIYQEQEKTWGPYPKYRASVITRAQLEQMIWRER